MQGFANWEKLTWQEKREDRFKRWLSPKNVKFVSPEAEKLYKERVTRFMKAIRLEEVTVTDDRGNLAVVQRPYVLEDTCIGCGICEYQCPVAGEAAILVYRR